MKKILEILTGLAFVVSLLCAISFGPDMTAGQQVCWSLGWMIICGLSGRAFYKLHGEPYKHMEP